MIRILTILLLICSVAQGQNLRLHNSKNSTNVYRGILKYSAHPSWSLSDSLWLVNRKYVDSLLSGAGAQTIQQVLTTGDTAQRKIIFKGIGDTTLSLHSFLTATIRPQNYNLPYSFGRQGLWHQGYGFSTGVNASGRPNLIYDLLTYNGDVGATTRVLSDEAAFRIRAETHAEVGGARLFRFYMPRVTMQDGFIYLPSTWEIGKDARSATWAGQLTSFSGYYLPPSGSSLDSLMFTFAAAGHQARTFGNGSWTLQNARNTSNSFVLSLTDNGPSFTSSGSAGSILTSNNGMFITHTANTSSLSLSPGNSVTTVAFSINAGTTAAGRALENITVNAAGVATAIYNNSNTTAANYFSHQVQSGSGRPEYVLWQNSNNYWITRFRGNSADDSSYRFHYVGTDVFYIKKNGATGIGALPGARRLYVNGSVGANKDSIPTVTSLTSNFILLQDTASGADQGRLRKILPTFFASQSALNDTAAAIRSAIGGGGGGITSINSETGPAFTIASGNGMTVTTTTNTATINFGGTLSGLAQIAGAGNNMTLGTGGSKIGSLAMNVSSQVSLISDSRINLLGNIAYQAENVTADANYTVLANTGIVELNTAGLTTDRTVTLPSATTHGQVLTIVVRFASAGSHFTFASAVLNNATGTNVTQLEWGTTYKLMVNASLAWMIIGID